MNALRLPPVYTITQAGKLGIDTFMLRLRTVLQNGVRLVQVREKEMDAHPLRALFWMSLEYVTPITPG